MPSSTTDPVQPTPHWVEKAIDVLVEINRGFWFIFVILMLGLIAALLCGQAWNLAYNLSGFDPALRAKLMQWPSEQVRHIAWVVGAVFATIGQPLGWMNISWPWTRERKPLSHAAKETMRGAARPAAPPGAPRPFGVALAAGLKTGAFGALIGLCIGIYLGLTVVAMMLSFAYSPWVTPAYEPLLRGSLNVPYAWVPLAVMGFCVIAMGMLFFVGELTGNATPVDPASEPD